MIPQSQSFQRRQELSGERKKSHSTIMSEVGVYSALLGSSTFLHSTAQHFFGITSHSILYGFAQKKWRFSLSFLPLCLLWKKCKSRYITSGWYYHGVPFAFPFVISRRSIIFHLKWLFLMFYCPWYLHNVLQCPKAYIVLS